MRYYRKVIRIRAEDSPNVKLAMVQQRLGKTITNEILVPGVLSWPDYLKRRETWDRVRQCIGLDGDFYEGSEVLLFPPHWLNHSESLAESLKGKSRKAKAIGIDPAEGGDKTAMAAVDELGLIELVSKKTQDTSIVTNEALAFMRKHKVPPEKVMFDRGGGGKEHADRLRSQGYAVTAVGFGESVILEPRRGMNSLSDIRENREERYVYKNRRAEMYGELSLLLDPIGKGFAIPAEYTELRRQLSVIEKLYDGEGRLVLPPKNKPSPNSTVRTLIDIIGHSPDEADALVIAVHSMMTKARTVTIGAF